MKDYIQGHLIISIFRYVATLIRALWLSVSPMGQKIGGFDDSPRTSTFFQNRKCPKYHFKEGLYPGPPKYFNFQVCSNPYTSKSPVAQCSPPWDRNFMICKDSPRTSTFPKIENVQNVIQMNDYVQGLQIISIFKYLFNHIRVLRHDGTPWSRKLEL